VWNDIQVHEAIRYHALPEANIACTGAPVFDWAFTREGLQSRNEFCLSTGLDPALPYVVYAVSSAINSGDEIPIVHRLQRRLEELEPGRIQVLVRPYPNAVADWHGLEASGIHVGFPPERGRTNIRNHLLNTLYYSAAVAGLNTSVFLEAAILDRPGLTMLFNLTGQASRRKRHTQFLHFEYLLRGDFLEVSDDEVDCAAKIVAIVRGGDTKRAARAAFVRDFIRPGGIAIPASRVVVDRLEVMCINPSSGSNQPVARLAVSPTP
jgi:hypothetical protein